MDKDIKRVVILNLDSFVSGPGVNVLLNALHDQCVLVCESKRFGKKYGGVITQTRRTLRKSGFSFTFFQALNLLWYKPMLLLLQAIFILLGRRLQCLTLKQLSRKFGIPHIALNSLRATDISQRIAEVKPDLIISFYFDHLITSEIIKLARIGVINVHTAKLPSCRGPFPVLCTFLKNIEPTVTVHWILDENFDTGPVIKQQSLVLPYNIDMLNAERIAMEEVAKLVINIVRTDVIDKGVPQSSEGSYMSFPDKTVLHLARKHGLRLFSIKDYFRALI